MNCPNKITYVIMRGDTLYLLARKFNTTVENIMRLNPLIDPYNLRIGSKIYICPNDEFDEEGDECEKMVMRSNAMRLAWLQQAYWTRMQMVSTVEKLGDLTAVTEQLMHSPRIIADLFADDAQPFDVVNIEHLLTEGLQIGGEMFVALADNDMEGAERLSSLWYKNADEIAVALNRINPRLSKSRLRKMLHSYLDLTVRQTAKRLAKKYNDEIEIFNDIEQEILSLADYIALTNTNPSQSKM